MLKIIKKYSRNTKKKGWGKKKGSYRTAEGFYFCDILTRP